MALAPARSTARRDTFSFILCVVLATTALFLPRQLGDRIATVIRSTVLVPALWLQRTAEQGRTSRARFEAVVAQRDSAALAAGSLQILSEENDRLRALLGLRARLPASYVPADVLHQPVPTDGRTILLSVGSRRGVREFDAVVSPEGLVGFVHSVTPDFSLALTWAHPEFRASAYTRDGGIFGIVAPAGAATASESLLELRGVPYRDSIPAGVAVLSSGLGGVFPQGIPIGTIIGISREEPGWERTYLLRPAANPVTVTHVMILAATTDSSLQQAFDLDSVSP
ncbi:MAG: rod shape-determining protein MreC [Gemmatimonadales bacterium]